MKRKSNYTPRKDRVKRVRAGSGASAAFRRDVARGRFDNYGRTTNELKGMDTLVTEASAIVNTTNDGSNTTVLNLVPPGSGSFNRVGRKIRMKSVRLRGIARLQSGQASTTGNYQFCPLRMVVVFDKQPSGALPVFSDIFGYTPQTGTEASTPWANLRYDNTDRFKVLKDCLIQPSVAVASALSGGTETDSFYDVPFDEYIKLKGLETVYSGQSATQTIADISSGALYVIWRVPSASVASTFLWTVSAVSLARLRYYD